MERSFWAMAAFKVRISLSLDALVLDHEVCELLIELIVPVFDVLLIDLSAVELPGEGAIIMPEGEKLSLEASDEGAETRLLFDGPPEKVHARDQGPVAPLFVVRAAVVLASSYSFSLLLA
jgi:hypothetical protein